MRTNSRRQLRDALVMARDQVALCFHLYLTDERTQIEDVNALYRGSVSLGLF